MAPRNGFKAVESIGLALPDVEVTTAWGQPALKVRGKMFACIASHKSAEPNTLVVMMDFVDRDALIEDDPATYYLKEHYVNYPCVLVRMSRIRRDALRDGTPARSGEAQQHQATAGRPASGRVRFRRPWPECNAGRHRCRIAMIDHGVLRRMVISHHDAHTRPCS